MFIKHSARSSCCARREGREPPCVCEIQCFLPRAQHPVLTEHFMNMTPGKPTSQVKYHLHFTGKEAEAQPATVTHLRCPNTDSPRVNLRGTLRKLGMAHCELLARLREAPLGCIFQISPLRLPSSGPQTGFFMVLLLPDPHPCVNGLYSPLVAQS